MTGRPFISEDDLNTFEGWLRYQAVNVSNTTPDQMSELRAEFDKAMQEKAALPRVGRMKLKATPGEYRYAVAVRDGGDLWLVMWVRRSAKGEFFIMRPTPDGFRTLSDRTKWDPHTSYHLDGTIHMKSYGRKAFQRSSKHQPPTGAFRGTEHLGAYMGFAPRGVGAVCHPDDFSGVIEVPTGILGAATGSVSVDLIEPHQATTWMPWSRVVVRKAFRDFIPWVVITVRTELPG